MKTPSGSAGHGRARSGPRAMSVAVRQSRNACVRVGGRIEVSESEMQSVSDGRNEMASERSGRIRELRVAVKEVTEGK